MNHELKFNILGLKTSGLYNDDIPNRDRHVNAAISTALVHSSLYWAEYFQGITNEDLDCALRAELKRFLHEHFLEVLSLMKAAHRAPELLTITAKWVRVSTFYHDSTYCFSRFCYTRRLIRICQDLRWTAVDLL